MIGIFAFWALGSGDKMVNVRICTVLNAQWGSKSEAEPEQNSMLEYVYVHLQLSSPAFELYTSRPFSIHMPVASA